MSVCWEGTPAVGDAFFTLSGFGLVPSSERKKEEQKNRRTLKGSGWCPKTKPRGKPQAKINRTFWAKLLAP